MWESDLLQVANLVVAIARQGAEGSQASPADSTRLPSPNLQGREILIDSRSPYLVATPGLLPLLSS